MSETAKSNNTLLNKIVLGIASFLLGGLMIFLTGQATRGGRFTDLDGANLRAEMIEADAQIRRDFTDALNDLEMLIIRCHNGGECK